MRISDLVYFRGVTNPNTCNYTPEIPAHASEAHKAHLMRAEEMVKADPSVSFNEALKATAPANEEEDLPPPSSGVKAYDSQLAHVARAKALIKADPKLSMVEALKACHGEDDLENEGGEGACLLSIPGVDEATARRLNAPHLAKYQASRELQAKFGTAAQYLSAVFKAACCGPVVPLQG